MSHQTPASSSTPLDFLAGGGEMGERIRELDWSKTSIGHVHSWPQSLRTAVGLMLSSKYPMFIAWGPELAFLYNDAYRPIFARKHPGPLGRPFAEIWSEIWDDIQPLVTCALAGEATWSENLQLFMERSGYREEMYATFSYSPMRVEGGGVGGMLCACNETTQVVIGERRLASLREVAAAGAEARSWRDACERSASALGTNLHDLPFALIYIEEPDGGGHALVGASGIEAGHWAAPARIPRDAASPWPLSRARESRGPVLLDELPTRTDAALPTGPWSAPPRQAALLPIQASAGGKKGVLVVGLNRHRAFDEGYRDFLSLLAGQVSSGIAAAEAFQSERQRAEALAELDRAKTLFFSNVSHEFRTPLTLLLGPLEDVLSAPGALPPKASKDLAVSHRNAQRLLKLVNTLLDFSRIEAGRSQACYEPVDLAAYTAELASSFRSACEKAGLRLLVECGTLDEPVYVDRDMWEKVVLNLVSNAFKFTFQGEIEVRVAEVGGKAELAVRDTGIGIPAEELPRMFERFHRINDGRGRTHEGTGIGLALVHELVKLHGGTVEVESALEQGSRFIVTLPFGQAHLDPQRVSSAAGLKPTDIGSSAFVVEALRWLPDAGEETEPAGSSEKDGGQHVRPAAAHGSRILWADDNADMRAYVKRLLGSDYAVEAVADGEAALAAARSRPPDLVLADVMMPRLDGFGLLRALRADPATAEIPVVLLSARAGEEARVEGLQAGADDYLVKPFSAKELKARVASHLESARARRETTAAIRESERRFRAMADMAPAMLWVTEPDGSCSFLSLGWLEFTGQTVEEALGFGWLRALHPEDRSEAEKVLLAANAERAPFALDYRLRRADGAYRWTIDAGRPRFDEAGVFRGYIGSVIDVHDRRCAEAERELVLESERAARAEADRAGRLKDEFLAILSHELRSPLNAIVGYTQLLKHDRGNPETLERYIEVIERNTKLQAQLIADLLDMSRIHSGKLRLRLEAVDLEQVIEAAVAAVEPAARAKRVDLRISVVHAAKQCAGDPARLQQIVWNLVTNAVKFTPSGGSVEIRASPANEELEITVSDTGEGIDASFLPYVFEQFRQADSSAARKHGGLGLGLTLVKELTELHGGTVQAFSDGAGKGATFTVKLPLATADPAALSEGPLSSFAGVDLEGVSVLVVDDDSDAVELLKRIIEENHAKVTTASGVDEALAWLETHEFDVLISDLGMPGRDGYELIKDVRDRGIGIPAAAVTGFVRNLDKERALARGYQAHIGKPIQPAHVVQTIAALSGRGTKAHSDLPLSPALEGELGSRREEVASAGSPGLGDLPEWPSSPLPVC